MVSGKQSICRIVSRVESLFIVADASHRYSSCVDSIAVDVKEQKLTVIGEMDTVAIAKKLKKIGKVEIVTVGPAKEEKKDDKKDEKKDEKKDDKK
ncbi:actin-depolymerizing factor family protein [Hibiscus syriacus]|uniref:Actin-depolymerizing factor family protein n=1 Tax=Hibiscus syriacus TaxID=106335 RepID=A0A6A2X861_HIBSY|nr:actin-depolymerizing factor family protein [Hibiscus syriacus]